MTTPQAGAYNDIVRTARANGIPVATTNSFDGGILDRNAISHTGQDASAAAIAGEAPGASACSTAVSPAARSCFPLEHAMGNIEVNNRVTSAYNAMVTALEGRRQARQLQGRCRAGKRRRRNRPERSGQRHRLAVRVAR